MPRRAASASHLPGHPGVEEKGRGEETRPLWLALLLEPLRLRLDRNPRGGGSPTRQRSPGPGEGDSWSADVPCELVVGPNEGLDRFTCNKAL